MPILAQDDYTSAELTDLINDTESAVTPLQSLGIFEESGIRTTDLKVERQVNGLKVVPVSARGSNDGTTIDTPVRDLITFESVRLLTKTTLSPEDLQDFRAFGQSAEGLEDVESELRDRSVIMRDTINANLERLRFGAIKGKVFDANGTTVIYDMFAKFGYTQITKEVAFGTSSNFESIVLDSRNDIDKVTKGALRSGYMALSGTKFIDSMHKDKDFKETYRLYQESAQARNDLREKINYKGVDWVKCDDGIGDENYIPEDEAYLFPIIKGMFVTRFTPADMLGAVNKKGLPFYQTSKDLDHDMGVELWARSLPIVLNTRPHAVIRLKLKP